MSIVVNGTNLKSATFNGQDVDSIYYNGSLVWELPPEIQLISGIQSDGKAWIQTDFGSENFNYSQDPNTISYAGYVDIRYHFEKKLDKNIGRKAVALFTNANESIQNNELCKCSFGVNSGNGGHIIASLAESRASVIGPEISNYYDEYRISYYGKLNRLSFYYNKYPSSSEGTNIIANTTPTFELSPHKYQILKGGDETLHKNFILHSIEFGYLNDKVNRFLQPAIMKRKGVETVGLYDAKRGIFYGPQEGSFIPHY